MTSAVQRCLNPVRNSRWEFIGPLSDSLIGRANFPSSQGNGAPEQADRFIFSHAALNHSSAMIATMVLSPGTTVPNMGVPSATDYQQRLAAALRHAGRDPELTADVSWFAGAISISYQAARKVFDGHSKALSAANNALAARALGVSPDWLALGERDGGPMLGSSPFSPELLAKAKSASPEDRRKAENAARNVLDLEMLVRPSGDSQPADDQHAFYESRKRKSAG